MDLLCLRVFRNLGDSRKSTKYKLMPSIFMAKGFRTISYMITSTTCKASQSMPEQKERGHSQVNLSFMKRIFSRQSFKFSVGYRFTILAFKH